jgi:hypothetical protein
MEWHGGPPGVRRWRILITNDSLARRAGADTAVRDLALGLQAAGQTPMVYSPHLGEMAGELGASGIPVVSELRRVPEEPDIVHGNQHVETMDALLHFSKARGLFVCHHRIAYVAAPPRIDRIRRYVAVDYNCLERLTDEYRIPVALTRVIYNSVDTSRFLQRGPLPPAPRRAVVFSNYAGRGTYLEAVQVACALLQIPLDVIGSGSGHPCAAPEAVLGRYDLVFAKARCALEAMAVGAAVVLCDAMGLGPMVTASELADLRPWNFGMRVLRAPLDPMGIVGQVRRYDPGDALVVSNYIRHQANLAVGLEQYLGLYREIMEEPARDPRTTAEELDEYVRETATRIHQLETELAEFRRPYRMEPLSNAACERLALVITACPQQAECTSTLQVRVELENGSVEKLGSFPPFPVHLSYRWLRSETDDTDVIGVEAIRTPIRPSLPPGEKATYSLSVLAPDEPGRYRLRVTLVQESVRWLDTVTRPVGAEAVLSLGLTSGCSIRSSSTSG